MLKLCIITLLSVCILGCESTTPTDPIDAKLVLDADRVRLETAGSPPVLPPQIPATLILPVHPYIVKGGWCGEGGLMVIACYLTGCTASRDLLRQQEKYLSSLKSITTDEICQVAQGFWGIPCGYRVFETVRSLKENLVLGSPLLVLVETGDKYHALVVYGYDEREIFFHDTTGPSRRHKSYRSFMRLIAGIGYTFVRI